MDTANFEQAAVQPPQNPRLASTIGRSSRKSLSKSPSRAPVVTESPEVIREKAIKVLAAGLGKLGKTADGMHYAYLNLRLENQQLATLAGIDAFPHLQHVQVSNNAVDDLTPLGSLPYLTTLEASYNRLTRVWSADVAESSSAGEGKQSATNNNGASDADGNGPAGEARAGGDASAGPSQDDEAASQRPRRVLRMDVSYNKIRTLRGVSAYQLLRVLVVDNNDLVSLEGVANMASLQHLSARNNHLQSLDHLTGLMLKFLDVSNNEISSLEQLASIPSLEVLIAANNSLTRLDGLNLLTRLTTLDVCQNKGVAKLEEIRHLMVLPLLRRFRFAGTAMASECDARLHVLYRLPALTELDGAEVHPREKVTAANLHGADAPARAGIRRKYFPNGEFEDTIVGGQAALTRDVDKSSSGVDKGGSNGSGAKGADGVTADGSAEGVDSVVRPLMRAMRLVGKSVDNVGRATAGPTSLKPQASSRFLLSTGTAGFTRQTSALLGMSTRGAGGGAGDVAAQERAGSVPEELLRGILAGPRGQGGLASLAGHLAEGSDSEYEVARACFLWVVQNALKRIDTASSSFSSSPENGHDGKRGGGQPGRDGGPSGTGTPLVDLLLDKCQVAEDGEGSSRSGSGNGSALVSPGAAGAPWAERVALLFAALAQACQLEAAVVHGLAKGPSFESASDGGAMVGLAGIKARGKGGKAETGLEPHCWSAVKVTGKWKLLDCAWACSAGVGMDDHFFCLPDEFIYHHFPKKERWQLLDSSVTLPQFCALPTCTPAFFRYRMQLLACPTAALKLPPGTCAHHIPLGVPPEVSVLHRLVPMSLADRDARGEEDRSAAALCSWTLTQREESYVSLFTAFPGSGEYLLEVFAFERHAAEDADAVAGDDGFTNSSAAPGDNSKPGGANRANGAQEGSLSDWPSVAWGELSPGGRPCRYDRVLAYRVTVTVSCPGERFPEQSPNFIERGCSLRMPLEGFLVPGRSGLRQKFAMTAPRAMGIMLVVRPRPGVATGKERAGPGWWSGPLGVPPTRAQGELALEAPGFWTGDQEADSPNSSYLCMWINPDNEDKDDFFMEVDLVECTKRMQGPLALVVVGCFDSEDDESHGSTVPLLVFPIM